MKTDNNITAPDTMVGMLNGLLADARDQVMTDHDNVAKPGPELEAEIMHRMLHLAEGIRRRYRSAQGFIVAAVARDKLWAAHPNVYRSLREFLRDAGIGESTVSDLVALGEIIIPFCDHHNLDINAAIGPDHWAKTRETIPTLRRLIAGPTSLTQASVVQSVLTDAIKAPDRQAVRYKYRRHRAGLVGEGTTIRLATGQVAMVILFDEDGDHIGQAVHKLGGLINWCLIAAPQIRDNSIVIVVEN